jgi:preprotein translocase subunit SecG
MLKVLFTIVHIAVSLVLILSVLLQTGKRADLAGAFGGGGSQTAFGARGTATVLSKLTTISAVTFMITSLALVILAQQGTVGGKTVLDEVDAPAPVQQQAPVVPPAGDSLPAPIEGDDAAPSGGSDDPLAPAEGETGDAAEGTTDDSGNDGSN